VYSEPGQGTTFKIYLPRYQAEADSRPEKVKRFPIKRGRETILLVEDEPAILKMTMRILEGLGYQVMAASSAGEAISLAQDFSGNIHLLLTDVVMPEMNGRDLARTILTMHPNLRRLFMSGYTANVIAHHGVLDEGVNFIQKPFSREQLGAKIREALDGGEV
jgi:CheY-like chemotaxis protein